MIDGKSVELKRVTKKGGGGQQSGGGRGGEVKLEVMDPEAEVMRQLWITDVPGISQIQNSIVDNILAFRRVYPHQYIEC